MNNFVVLEKEMNKKYINRKEEIRSLILATLVGGNVVLLGPAGTAKTDMVQTLAKHINAKSFETLLAKTSAPEELFGAYQINELKKGNYVRNTENTLIDSEVAFVDEVFKCNSEVLNSMLGVLAQRTFRNGNSMPEKVKTELVVGASNEMPEGGSEGNLAALWDRFELRHIVENITKENDLIKLLNMDTSLEPKTNITLEEVLKAREEIKEIQFDDVIENIKNIWAECRGAEIYVSDRKWRNLLRYLRANAWMNGNKEVFATDLKVLKHILWQEPEQIKKVNEIVEKYAKDMNKETFNKAKMLADGLIESINSDLEDGELTNGQIKEYIEKWTEAVQLAKGVNTKKLTEDQNKEYEAMKKGLKEIAAKLKGDK